MALQYVQVGDDEDGNPVYDWVDDGVYDTDPGVITGPGSVPGSGGGVGAVTGTGDDGMDPNVPADPGVITGPGSVPGSGGGVGAVTGTGGNAALPGLSWDKLTKWLSTPGGAAIGIAGLDRILGGKLGSLMGFGTAGNAGAAGYKGKVPELTAMRTQIAQPAYVPYSGQAVMGRKHFSDIAYTPTSTATAPTAPTAPTTSVEEPVRAADGGIMNLARGGVAKPPRYLRGVTDGMADKIATDIDGKQAAKLSHGEFVVPADVVSHLGNGNSDAGAKVLYKMMDRVRVARTGNPKQGKKINPDKFTPGGLASLPAYAAGGAVAFDAGGPTVTPNPPTAAPVTRESNLSEWAGPTVTNMVGKATALAQSPYEAYTGPLTAGTSPLQQQAFTAAGNLQTPAAMGTAATALENIGTKMGGLSYTPSTATNAYTAPTGYTAGQVGNVYTPTAEYKPQAATSQFKGPADYQAGEFSNQYGGIAAYAPQTAANQFKGPAAYQATKFDSQYEKTDPYAARDVTVDKFSTAAMRDYMNPYLQMSLDPQIAEVRRQSQITQMGNAAKLAQAGAYGGSRGALMDTETQRNLLQNLAGITGQGYNTAFNTALNAFNTQQGLGLQAQQASEASRQFGANQALANAQNAAKFGMDAQTASEASKQFGAGQAMTAAQQAAQYGQAANQLSAQERQFGSSQALADAQSKAQYGQAAAAAREASRQFGSGQAMTAAQAAAQYGQAAQAQNAQQQQFAASQALANAQNTAQYGLAGYTAGEQAKQAQASQAAQIAAQQAQYGQAAQALNAQQQQFGAGFGLQALQGQQSAANALGGLGMQQGQLGLANLNALTSAGATQRDIEQQGITALKGQFEEQRQDPYNKLLFQQKLLAGLPIGTQTTSTAQTPFQSLGGTASELEALLKQMGL